MYDGWRVGLASLPVFQLDYPFFYHLYHRLTVFFLQLYPFWGILISKKISCIFTGKYRRNSRLRWKFWRDASKKSQLCSTFIQVASIYFAKKNYRCYPSTNLVFVKYCASWSLCYGASRVLLRNRDGNFCRVH